VAQDIADGYTPFFVNVTAGTTVLGAFDSIEKIGAIAKKHNIWIHVDGAYCGGVIFSKKYRHLVNGLEMADSFCFNAHKMLGTPLSCSIIVTPHKKALHDSFSNDAEYLYQTDADDYNLGKTSLQCGRKNDALKFWTLWKAVGTDGLERIVDNQFYLADVAQEYVANHPDYALYSHPNSISVCYNYKDIPAPDLCTKLYEDAATLVGYGKFRDTEFVRFVTINATNTKEDILNFFKVMEAGA
jgi:glutamate/tyrosine decarboxylase-like PLP-dependent enzyme